MGTLFPEDPQLQRFASRFTTSAFDPTAIRPVISPRTQMRPVMPSNVMATIEEPFAPPPPVQPPQEHRIASPAVLNSPRMAHLHPVTNSPKRPLEDTENDQPRKFVRGESPLKGAAGRRLDARRQMVGNTPVAAPAGWPREINFLLSIIPNAATYNATRFVPERLVELLQNITLPLPAQQAGAFPPGAAGAAAATAAAAAAAQQGPPSAHIGAQLQNIQARYGGGSAWPTS